MSDLIRTLAEEELEQDYVDECGWTGPPNCARMPEFRIATPHGHMDFCQEHVGYMIVSLPQEWLDGFAYREPEPLTFESDDIPF